MAAGGRGYRGRLEEDTRADHFTDYDHSRGKQSQHRQQFAPGVWRIRLYRHADYPDERAKECLR